MDDTFGGVIIERPEHELIVQVGPTRTFSGYSGYSGAQGPPGQGGGGGGGSGFSSFSGFSGRSGDSGRSGFSGFSSSGFSGFSGTNVSGFSGFSGASGLSGASGPGGGNSGYSGYSGLDGTFSASGFSGFSGFSARSGFSGFSGSGVSGYSGYSGQSISGFSGFSGTATSGFSGFSSTSGFSGFSGFSGRSGFSGGPSGFSGFSGTGSPPGGVSGNFQFNSGTGTYAGQASLTSDGTNNTFATATRFFFTDPVDPTKTIRFDAAALPSAGNVIVSVGGNSVTVIPSPALTNQFVTGINTTGVVTRAQPSFSNLSGLVTFGQLDRTTAVVAETPTITIAANTRIKSNASGTLTTIAFSGGDSAAQSRRLDLDITGGPYTINIPACRRLGETGTISTLQIFAGYNEFSWEFINGEYVLSDSVSSATLSGSGTSGFSGFSGTGVSGFSGRSGFSGAGTSGFSGFSGGGGSGFSGFSGPSLIPFSTRNDTDYTLTIGDANTGVKMVSAIAHSLTVPPNSSVPFPVGTQIPIEQGGTAAVSIVAGVGVTLQGAIATSGQYSVVVLIKQATDTWLVAKSGTSGYSGYSGGAGSAGSSGFSGFSGGGPSGFSGFSGAGQSGFSGFSSFSGLSGFSGRSGYSGYSAPSLLSFSTQTDVDYTLVLGDANTGVKMTSAAAHNLTIPTNASVAFPIGTQIPIEQGGAGVVTIVASGGVTMQGTNKTAGQFSMVVLIKQATDTWLVASGNSGYSGYSGVTGGSGSSGFSGFSGANGWTRFSVSGSADAITTGQTLVDITGLVTGTLLNATLYEIRALLYVSTTGTAGTQYGIFCGGSGTVGVLNALMTGTTSPLSAVEQTINLPGTPSATLMTGGGNGTVEIRGFVLTRSTGAATISLQHLKVTSGTSTVKGGSYLEYRTA